MVRIPLALGNPDLATRRGGSRPHRRVLQGLPPPRSRPGGLRREGGGAARPGSGAA